MKGLRLSFILATLFLTLACAPAVTFAADEWLKVRSKNFTLVGNAPEKDIRRVATRLEEFREAFRQVFNRSGIDSSVPTTVVVFKSQEAYRPFVPRRADGSIDGQITGYFVPSDDVNYITLASRGNDTDLTTVFHEYIHFIVSANYGRTGVPPWFNEGLAEYYETFSIDNESVRLGLIQNSHLRLLKRRNLMPLEKLFAMTSYGLEQESDHGKSIFYAQAWALVHYLLQDGKLDGLNKFLTALLRGTTPAKAFEQAFKMTYAEMEVDLKAYISKRIYNYRVARFPIKLSFDTELKVSAFDEASTNATLGDLLYHLQRSDDAEPFLINALRLQPEMAMANTTLGMVRIQQRKPAEAKAYLEKAIAADPSNFIARYRYASLLSYEDRDEFGMINSYAPEKAARIKGLLREAIAVNPTFSDSYELLGFIAMVTNDGVEEAIGLLQQALKYRPGTARYLLRLAELQLRLDRFDEARQTASQALAASGEQEIKSWAADVTAKIDARQAALKDIERNSQGSPAPAASSGPQVVHRTARTIYVDRPPTPEEEAKLQADAYMRSLNLAISSPEAGQTRVVGSIDGIECSRGVITYSVRSGDERFGLTSKNFQDLKFRTFTPGARSTRIDCGTSFAGSTAILIYRNTTGHRPNIRGELLSVEFVPADFRFVDTSAEAPPAIIYPEKDSVKGPATQGASVHLGNDEMRRSMMIGQIRSSLRRPRDGEVRDIGRVESLECTKEGVIYTLKTTTRTLRLTVTSPESLAVRGFTPDIDGLQITCGVSLSDLQVVFIYKDVVNTSKNTAGELVSLEFVPRSFSF